MASLNLVPNPTVMVVQAGLFIANFVAVKKLLLDPYLKVYDKRQNLTVGSQSEAADLVGKNEKTMSEIKERLAAANQQAGAVRAELSSKASAERNRLVSEAEAKARETVEAVRQQIKDSLGAEKAKVPGLVEELSTVIVNQVLEA